MLAHIYTHCFYLQPPVFAEDRSSLSWVRTVFSPQKSRINLGSQPKKASAGKQGSLKQIVIVHDDHIWFLHPHPSPISISQWRHPAPDFPDLLADADEHVRCYVRKAQLACQSQLLKLWLWAQHFAILARRDTEVYQLPPFINLSSQGLMCKILALKWLALLHKKRLGYKRRLLADFPTGERAL